MGIARRGSRPITVEGLRFRWRIRRRATAGQRSGQSPLILAVAAAQGGGPTLLVYAQPHPLNTARHRSHALTPGHVAAYIREGLAAGWRPCEPGPQFVLDPVILQVSERLRIVPPELEHLGVKPEALARLPRRDRFRLTKLPRASYGPIGFEINGRALIDLVREVERPLVDAELAKRRMQGQDLDSDYAGEYVGMSVSQACLPSTRLLGEMPSSEASFFSLEPDDPRTTMTTLMTCPCGITECWFLLVKITVLEEVVVWSNFEQFHRAWIYDLGPFVFDKKAYLAALDAQNISSAATESIL